jgi:hypothetical protein
MYRAIGDRTFVVKSGKAVKPRGCQAAQRGGGSRTEQSDAQRLTIC